MDAVQWIEYLNEQGTIVAEALVGNKAAETALKALMREADTQINDRDKEIRRLEAQVGDLTAARDSYREDKRAAETRADKTYAALQEEKTKTETLRKEAAYLIAEVEKLKANRAAIIARSQSERVPNRENETPPDNSGRLYDLEDSLPPGGG